MPVFQLTLTQLLLPLPYRLPPLLVKVCPLTLSTSRPVPAVLPSMMVSKILLTVAKLKMPPPLVDALLPEMVSLLSVRVLALL